VKTISALAIVLSFIFMIAGLSYMGASLAHASQLEIWSDYGEPSKTPIYVDHVRAWYDAKQQHATGPPEPVYFSGFYVVIPKQVQCNSWVPVNGIIPKDGLLTFTVISGDYIGFSNVSHMSNSFLINYFWLPCNGADKGAIYVTFIYSDYSNTIVKNLIIDKAYLQIEKQFEVIE